MAQPAKLEISRNTIDRGERRLDVLAPITKRASGEVGVELHAAGDRYRFDADVNPEKGYVRFRKQIPRAQARLGTGIVTITYSGNERTRGQEVRLRAASRRAELDAQRPELEVIDGQLRLQSEGKLSERARGVVRVQLDWVDSAGADRSYETNAKIDDGAWRLSEELPGEVGQSIEARRSTVHSYTLFTGYLRARMRGEMKAYQVLGEPIVDRAANPAGPAPLAEEGLPASSPTESQASSPPPSTMRAGDSLLPGDRLVSPNAAYQLVMEHDGNLTLYQGSNALWSSATSAAGARADMQSDGNFVVRNGSTAEWHSHTAHYPNAAVHLQDDGNLVIRHAGRPVWTRGHGHVGDAVSSGQTLAPGAIARSDNGAYRLIMQGDGNLVLYQSKTALWSSATKTADSRAVMQTDGNLVISSGTAAKWNSRTDQYTGAALEVQDDGNLVIYYGGRPVWTRANGHIGHLLRGGQKLDAGELARSNNATYRLIMQGDGNLVLYKGGSALWSTKTNASGSRVEMQTDGNLVVYSGTTAKWNTGTAGNPGAYLAVQDDGNLVIYKGGAGGSTALWSRKAAQGPLNISNSVIADRAETRANGTVAGQCLSFVAEMIAEAGGPRYYFGYDDSTYQAQWAQRATEIGSLAEARRGDVIQWAGGRLPHTAIVTAAGADPSLIDSNYSGNETVGRGPFSSRRVEGSYRIWRVGKV